MRVTHIFFNLFVVGLIYPVAFVMVSCTASAQTSTAEKPELTKVGTHSILGKVDGINNEMMVQSPSNEVTPLQIICVFEYVDGNIYNSPPGLPAAANGLAHVDKQLNGLLTDLMKSGRFEGHALETILLIPPAGSIAARKLMIIGLGNRKDFTPDLMINVGRVGMLEALRLGVSSYAQASDLKDGGVDSPTAAVSQNMVKGMLEGYEADLFLQQRHAATKKSLTKVTVLAGQPFYEISAKAIKEYIDTRH